MAEVGQLYAVIVAMHEDGLSAAAALTSGTDLSSAGGGKPAKEVCVAETENNGIGVLPILNNQPQEHAVIQITPT